MSVLDGLLSFVGKVDPSAAALIALYEKAQPYLAQGIAIAQGVAADQPLVDSISAVLPQLADIASEVAEHFHGAAASTEHVESVLTAMVAPDRWTPEAERAWQDRAVGSS